MRIPVAALLLIALSCSHRAVVGDRELPRFDDPDAASTVFAVKRGITSSTNLHALYAAARASIASNPSTSLGAWSFLGPGNIGGRTRALLIDPTDSNVMIAGAVSGGVWKTTDGGANWRAVGDEMANLAVCTLAFDPSDPHTIYAGTGEGYFREDVRGTNLPITGDGIFVSHDSGEDWAQLPSTISTDFEFVNKLAVSARDPHRLYAATRSGVWRSADAGASWKQVLPVTVKGGCFDLALRRDTPGDTLLASCGIFEQATVYRATNAETDASWNSVLTDPQMGRTSLAIAPSNPSTVYALAACNGTANGCSDQGLLAVYRSDRGGDAGSWNVQARGSDSNPINATLLTNATSYVCNGEGHRATETMGWHANVIAVDPADPNVVWAAGVDLFRSTDGGRNWGEASYWWTDPTIPTFVHADQHVIAFDPHYDGDTNQTMFFANDGGVFRTDAARAPIAMTSSGVCTPDGSRMTFRSLNHNFGATQFYSGTVTPDGQRWMGGAQDNGTLLGDATSGPNGWSMIFGGDGGEAAFNPTNPAQMFAAYQWAHIARSDDGGASFSLTLNGLDALSTFTFVTPYTLDPDDPAHLWVGGARMFQSPNGGANWLAASTPISGVITAVAAARGSDRVVAGTSGGVILRNDTASKATGTTTWSNTQPRDGWVSSLTFDPANSDTIYATYATFGGAHVYRSLDDGATWSALGGLPDLPVHTLAVRGATLYAGTDLGLFVSTDAGATWAHEAGLPNVITSRLVLGKGQYGDALYAFTHGRGVWRVELNVPRHQRAAGRK